MIQGNFNKKDDSVFRDRRVARMALADYKSYTCPSPGSCAKPQLLNYPIAAFR
jgi:hypothetical protein